MLGVVSWHGRGVRFTEGICPRCTERIRRDLTTGWASGLPRWEAPMALPPMIVMVIATVVIALAARPLDWSPSLTPPARSGSVAVGGDEDDDVQVRHVRRTPARVLPPERVVYVPGWRAATTAPGPSASRPAKVRLDAAGLDDAGRPWAPAAVQAP